MLSRGSLGGADIPDDGLMSRRHARVSFDGAVWTVADLGSTNGTWIDGEQVRGEVRRPSIRVIRAGSSVFLPMPDIRRLMERKVRVEKGVVLGPALQDGHEMITRAAVVGGSLLITGESGTGKEVAARAFHGAGPNPRGPFVAVNCAAIPEGLAERLLFGARKGAYTGLDTDTEGYVQAANGGTLFLDEVAELEAPVQAKLLRTIETQQVMELGAVAPRPVQIRICAATHDLRARVAAGKFRQDLYYRIGRPEVRLPPLRERPEEIPWHLAETCAAGAGARPALSIDVSLVVACLLREWPGNVRELIREAQQAAEHALSDGRTSIEARDLDAQAGMGVTLPEVPAPQLGEAPAGRGRGGAPPEDEIAAALREDRGNVSAAAKRLGISRNKVRRWLDKHDVDRTRFAPGGDLAGRPCPSGPARVGPDASGRDGDGD
ncbi:MAG: sigma 54-interacting transcriptional regulator [Polyangiaceae bacterium]|nr:sigma 54-interacting transcriptional regulator [Polyangiaceae bacterium]